MFVSDAHIEREHRKWEKQKINIKNIFNIFIQNIALFISEVC